MLLVFITIFFFFNQGERGHLGLPGPFGPKGEGLPGPVVCIINILHILKFCNQ